jgi:uncharacterized phage protein (TIGR02220 family)
MSNPLYKIADWRDKYENNRTRELKSLSWVPFPNSHDGDGYTALMSHKNGEQLLGAFVVIVQVASKCDPRGTLLRGPAMPHTAASLARITRFSAKTIQQCLDVCCDREVGWIICEKPNNFTLPAGECDDPAGSCENPAGKCLEGNGKKEGKGMELSRIALHWLNDKAGRHYRETSENLDLIEMRLAEVGNDLEGVKLMISRQAELWKGGEMEEYLRPETLFGKKKFGGYYDNRNLPVPGLKRVDAVPQWKLDQQNENEIRRLEDQFKVAASDLERDAIRARVSELKGQKK